MTQIKINKQNLWIKILNKKKNLSHLIKTNKNKKRKLITKNHKEFL